MVLNMFFSYKTYLKRDFLKVNEYPLVDYVKLVMACFVIGIHVYFTSIFTNETLKRIVDLLFSLAVPYFFVCSGFFLFKNSSENNKRIIQSIKKIVYMYIIWTVLYFPYTIYSYYISDLSFVQGLISFIRGFLFVGEHTFSWPLWYLLALIVSVSLVYCMILMRLNTFIIVAIGFIMYCLGHYIDYLHNNGCNSTMVESIIDLYYKLFLNVRNGFFIGLFYVSIGVLVARIGRIKNVLLNFCIIIIGGFLAYCGFLLGLPLLIFALFSLTLTSVGFNKKAVMCRKISIIFYFTHMLLIAPVYILGFQVNTVLLYILVLTLLLLFSLFIFRYNGSKWYKYIYG